MWVGDGLFEKSAIPRARNAMKRFYFKRRKNISKAVLLLQGARPVQQTVHSELYGYDCKFTVSMSPVQLHRRWNVFVSGRICPTCTRVQVPLVLSNLWALKTRGIKTFLPPKLCPKNHDAPFVPLASAPPPLPTAMHHLRVTFAAVCLTVTLHWGWHKHEIY